MRILVVDDEAPIMALCLKILGRLGHEVEGVTRGEEALSKLASGPVDLLVVDYKMPGINGFEVVRRARSLHPKLRVVLITGHGNPRGHGRGPRRRDQRHPRQTLHPRRARQHHQRRHRIGLAFPPTPGPVWHLTDMNCHIWLRM